MDDIDNMSKKPQRVGNSIVVYFRSSDLIVLDSCCQVEAYVIVKEGPNLNLVSIGSGSKEADIVAKILLLSTLISKYIIDRLYSTIK